MQNHKYYSDQPPFCLTRCVWSDVCFSVWWFENQVETRSIEAHKFNGYCTLFCILTKWYLLTEMPMEIWPDEVRRHNVIGISVHGRHQSRKMKHVLHLDRTSVGRGEVLHPRGLAVAVEAYVMLWDVLLSPNRIRRISGFPQSYKRII